MFPASFYPDATSMDDMFSAAAAAATATTAFVTAATAAVVSAAPAATTAAIADEPKRKNPFDDANRLSDNLFGDNGPAAADINLDDYPEGSYVVTDRKGEPMVITPGDKSLESCKERCSRIVSDYESRDRI